MTIRAVSLAGIVMVALMSVVATGCDAQGYGYDRGPGYGYGYGGRPPPRQYEERREADDRRGDSQLRQRQERYNQSISNLQQQHNQGVVALQQQFNKGQINRQQLDSGVNQLGRQYGNSVAQQQRELTR
ncbi:hypothetical protein [Acidisphaera sp. L21]|jgi:hypothetical protein|uniref:hypothetical protein n=1 Tax=Acidisphaera sp. L21 TaxID=1641851 RepID=UPI00131E5449|nr:hypothetical protein [Acidisphaera sp. L21]